MRLRIAARDVVRPPPDRSRRIPSRAWDGNGLSGRAGRAWRPTLAALVATIALAAAAWLRRDEPGSAALTEPAPALDSVRDEVVAQFGMERALVWLVEPRSGNVWTREGLARVAALTRDVIAIPGVVATDVISIASPNMRDLRVSEEGLEPVYLMSEPPADDGAAQALRSRVERDPSYAGNLVTRDGRAGVVVANFASDADATAIARAALSVRDRYRDRETDVWVVGEPVLALTAPPAARVVLPGLLLALALGGAAAVAALGLRAALLAALAAGLACTWASLALVALRAASPWSVIAAPPTAALAAALTLTGRGAPRRLLAIFPALAVGGAAFAAVAGAPAAAAGIAIVAGTAFAFGAAYVVSPGTSTVPHLPARLRSPAIRRLAAAATCVALALAAAGLPRLVADYGLPGYGERYLPGTAGDDVRALARLFPPPSTFVVRLRGESGFVARPDVLNAMSDIGETLRRDPAVRDVQSLSDVVKRVHRAFNDDLPEFAVIPDDRALNARYLVLAYSPLFRRFVDRSLSQTALWVLVDGRRTADLERVRAELAAALAAHPLADVAIDPIVGDGRNTVAMAAAARRLARAGFVLVLVLAAGAAAGSRAATGVAAASVAAALAGAGLLGWLGLPVDLLAAALLVASALTAAIAALALATGAARDAVAAIAIALAAASVPLLAWPTAATRLLAIAALAPACAAAIWSIARGSRFVAPS